MATRTGLSFRVRSCQRCGGDAYLDIGDDREWRCLQCGRVVNLPAAHQPVESLKARRAA